MFHDLILKIAEPETQGVAGAGFETPTTAKGET